MADELARAFEFLRRADMAGERELRSALGTAVIDERLALRYDSNYLLVERDASPDELAAELERLGLRLAFFPDTARGERLAPALEPRGWKVSRNVVMVLRRTPERASDPGRVREVDEGALRPLRRTHIVSEPWGNEEVAETLLAAKERIAQRVTARFFAVVEDGEVVSYCDLYQDGPVAQVEDVATAERARGRGHASAVVVRAVEEARAAGAELVFLVADAEDWPKDLYRRLGFDEVGGYVKLIRPS